MSLRVFMRASFERESLRETRYLSLIPACDVKRINSTPAAPTSAQCSNTKARIRARARSSYIEPILTSGS